MNILFMCVGNSARSQIAEGLAKAMLNQEHQIQSAGSIPSGTVHLSAIACMESIGIDISQHYTKSINELDAEFINNLDYVITLCAEEVCPVLPVSAKSLHWMHPDPVNPTYDKTQEAEAFENTRESIFKLLKKFLILNT
ncbi:arsenate reductase ArsC [Gammaproteobacteria bacterium]|nr:arsenate reductase ArsC [Gammaproteobacteria bacterium]